MVTLSQTRQREGCNKPRLNVNGGLTSVEIKAWVMYDIPYELEM